MKKNLKLLLIIIILGIFTFIMYKLAFSGKNNKSQEDFSEIQKYIRDIYGTTFLISEFDDINEASEDWLWENVNQYVWNHDDEYHEQNAEQYGYSYDDISKIVKTLYGDNLRKKFPKGAVSMRYDSYHDTYGPTSFGITNYYDYRIESITHNNNIYTVSLYDYTISFDNFNENDEYFEIYNNYDYMLNHENGTPLLKIKDLNNKDFKNILDQKEKLSHKILTIEYNQTENLYYITSCKYKDTKENEILADMYRKLEKTFEIMSIDYKHDDIYVQEEILVNNFEELTSIYTPNAVQIYKDEMDIFTYRDNGEVYITAGDITVEDYLIKVEFENIESTDTQITCNVIRTFRESFDPGDEAYNNTYQKEDTFRIVKQNNTWLIDDFSYNK